MSRSTYAKDHRRDRPEKEERRRNRRTKIAAPPDGGPRSLLEPYLSLGRDPNENGTGPGPRFIFSPEAIVNLNELPRFVNQRRTQPA